MRKKILLLLMTFLAMLYSSTLLADTDADRMNKIHLLLDQYRACDQVDSLGSAVACSKLNEVREIILELDTKTSGLYQTIVAIEEEAYTIKIEALINEIIALLRTSPDVQAYLISKLDSAQLDDPIQVMKTKSLIRSLKGTMIEADALHYAERYSFYDAIVGYKSLESLKLCESIMYDTSYSIYSRLHAARRIERSGNTLPMKHIAYEILNTIPLTLTDKNFQAKTMSLDFVRNELDSIYLEGIKRITEDDFVPIRYIAMKTLIRYGNEGVSGADALIEEVLENSTDQKLCEMATEYLGK